MNRLWRELAPISERVWGILDDEARRALRPSLAARRLVKVEGPRGWEHSATNLGRVELVAVEPAAGVQARRRLVLPLVELRANFELSLDELQAAERCALSLDLSELDRAARRIAIAENVIVFHGYEDVGITGITQASSHTPLELGGDHANYPRQVARAVATLRASGVDGPYALVLGPEGYTGIVEAAERGGVLLLEHLQRILGGEVLWAPGVDGAVVVSLRGGDFLLELGADVSLGYESHDARSVRLYLEESCSFTVATPEAAVSLLL
jgi:uncharacterized linocin/CFP29 family protein